MKNRVWSLVKELSILTETGMSKIEAASQCYTITNNVKYMQYKTNFIKKVTLLLIEILIWKIIICAFHVFWKMLFLIRLLKSVMILLYINLIILK